MKRGVIGRFAFALILLTFLLSGVFAVPTQTCGIVPRVDCDDPSTEGYIVMGLSSSSNAHGDFPALSTSPYVLCCNFPIGRVGSTTCKGVSNKIIGLSSETNAHAEDKTGTYYSTSVCYEDIACEVKDVCLDSEKGILSLSSSTNAHIGPYDGAESYPNKVCCSANSMKGYAPCSISSVEWSGSNALAGSSVSLMVYGNGAQCGGKKVSFEVWKDQVIDVKTSSQPLTVTFQGATAEGTWTAETAGSSYYFKANVTASISVKSDNLAVLGSEWCDDNTIATCEDYSSQEYCESKLEDGSDLCNVATNYPPEGVTCDEETPCNCKWDSTNDICSFNWEVNNLGNCGDGVVNRPNSNGAREDCDPDTGINYFNTDEDTCLKLSSLSPAKGSYTGGTLGCGLSCAFEVSGCTPSNPTCGNNIVDQESESCDGTHLAAQSCQTLGYTGGTLSCDSSCHLVKSGCTGTPTNYCGDGKVNLNSGNFNEQCDLGDGPAGNDIINLNGKTCANVGLGTGSLSCKADCTFDYSSCSGTKKCGDGLVDRIEEECDGSDFQGATCKFLGFDEGTISCNTNCESDTSKCNGGETGTSSSCSYTSTVITNCEEGEGKKTIQWSGKWTGGETSGEAYTNCVTPITKTYPCPTYVQLPFFDYLQMFISMIVIAGIYALVILRKKLKKK